LAATLDDLMGEFNGGCTAAVEPTADRHAHLLLLPARFPHADEVLHLLYKGRHSGITLQEN